MKTLKNSRTLSFLYILMAYGTAFAAAWLTWRFLPETSSLLTRAFLADLAAASAIYIFSLISDNSSCYDAYWSAAPPVIFSVWIMAAQNAAGVTVRPILILAVTWLWGLRLTANWALSWPGLNHEDWRFVSLRGSTGRLYWPVSFLGLHIFPTVLVFLSMIPAYFAITAGPVSLNIMDFIASGAALGAIAMEWISDFQLSRHRESAEKDKPVSRGLWKFSRHPNYFGEILFWFSLYFFALAAAPGKYWTGFAPVIMLCQFAFVSIPMMEKRQLERKKGYGEIRGKVSILVPLPRKRWFNRPL
ncbi:MAG: DUF1295 domain-containing protein [Spirochaetales bacterium]|nr:DUF1295 domain-containing protein [Spirochaetales bacterium]